MSIERGLVTAGEHVAEKTVQLLPPVAAGALIAYIFWKWLRPKPQQ